MEFSIQSKRYPISKLRHERLINLSLKIELFRPSTMGHHSSEFCIPCSINSANILFGNSTDIPGSFKGYRQSIVTER